MKPRIAPRVPVCSVRVCVLSLCCCLWAHTCVWRHYYVHLGWSYRGKTDRHRGMTVILYPRTIIAAMKLSVPITWSHSMIKVERRGCRLKRMEGELSSLLPNTHTYKSLLVSTRAWARPRSKVQLHHLQQTPNHTDEVSSLVEVHSLGAKTLAAKPLHSDCNRATLSECWVTGFLLLGTRYHVRHWWLWNQLQKKPRVNPLLLVRILRLNEVKSLAHLQSFLSFIKDRHYTFIWEILCSKPHYKY